MGDFFWKWNDFDLHIRESFKQLRKDKMLFDVTLATDDGQFIEAHRIVLSVGSSFFRDIFTNSDHSNMLIYLKGIKGTELEFVTDFLYNGEVLVNQEYLNIFAEAAKELQLYSVMENIGGVDERNEQNIKIVDNEVNSKSQEIQQQPVPTVQSVDKAEIDHIDSKSNEQEATLMGLERSTKSTEEYDQMIDKYEYSHLSRNLSKQVTTQSNLETSTNLIDDVTYSVVNVDVNNPTNRKNNEYDNHLEQMVVKNEGMWMCKVCGKTGTSRTNIKSHTEEHVEGISYFCEKCHKTFPRKQRLNDHISRVHSELFSCEFCGKIGMNRGYYTKHKQRYHR